MKAIIETVMSGMFAIVTTAVQAPFKRKMTMNATMKVVVAVLVTVMLTGIVSAGSKERLMSSIKKQIRGQEAQIVSMWMSGKRDAAMEKILADYVVKNVRLQAMGGTPTSLYAKVNANGKEYKTTRSLAKALVLEHFKSKGIKFKDMGFVQGQYSLKVVGQ